MNKLNLILFTFLLFCSCLALSQPNLDSEKQILYDQYVKLSDEFYIDAVYDTSLLYMDSALLLIDQNTDAELFLDCKIRIAEVLRVNNEYEETIDLLKEAYNQVKNNLSDSAYVITSYLHKLGATYADLGKYDTAISIINQSLNLRLQLIGPTDTNLIYTYNTLGVCNHFLGQFKKGLEFYLEAIEVSKNKINQIDTDVAMLFLNAAIEYVMLGNFELAQKYFDRNLKINQQVLGEDNPNLARFYGNLGRYYAILENLDSAIVLYNLAEEIYVKNYGLDSRYLGNVYLNKGVQYSLLGDKEKALNYHIKSYLIFSQYLDATHPNIGKSLNNIGSIYHNKGQFELALQYYYNAMNSRIDVEQQSMTTRNIAKIYVALGDLEKAEEEFMRVFEITKQYDNAYHFDIGHSWIDYGDFLRFQKGDIKASRECYNKALEIFTTSFGEHHSTIAEAYRTIGDLQFELQEYDSALSYFQKSLVANSEVFSATDHLINPELAEVTNPIEFWLCLVGKAEVYSEMDAYDDEFGVVSVQNYTLAASVFEDIRSKVKRESKLLLTSRGKQMYDDAVATAYHVYVKTGSNEMLNKAFEFSEKGKAAILLSSIKDVEAIQFSGIPYELQAFEKSLQQKIRAYKKALYDETKKDEPSKDKMDLWESKHFDLNKTYDSLMVELEKEYPEYFQLKQNAASTSLTEVQENLSPEQVFIEYDLSDSVLFVFVVKKDSISIQKLNIEFEFYSHFENFRKSLDVNFEKHSLEDYISLVKSSRYLYDALIGPIYTKIKDHELIIVPDGILGYLPFECLVSEDPTFERINYRNLAYMMREFPISYAYSATLQYENTKRHPANDEFLAFAPTYGHAVDTLFRGESDSSDIKLSPLIFSDFEVNGINKLLKGDIYLAKKATETRFKEIAKDGGIIHLAMHALIDDSDPMYSKLVFTRESDSINDGYLNTYEIYNLELNAKMAVLSACNTGFGQINNGEGIMSLARGFLYAGVPSIVMTLWEVEDLSGAEIMTRYYYRLFRGEKKSMALRNAKIEYLNKSFHMRSHPYFWAAYVNIGNNDPIFFKSNFRLIVSIITGVAFIVLIVVIILQKRKRPVVHR